MWRKFLSKLGEFFSVKFCQYREKCFAEIKREYWQTSLPRKMDQRLCCRYCSFVSKRATLFFCCDTCKDPDGRPIGLCIKGDGKNCFKKFHEEKLYLQPACNCLQCSTNFFTILIPCFYYITISYSWSNIFYKELLYHSWLFCNFQCRLEKKRLVKKIE